MRVEFGAVPGALREGELGGAQGFSSTSTPGMVTTQLTFTMLSPHPCTANSCATEGPSTCICIDISWGNPKIAP